MSIRIENALHRALEETGAPGAVLYIGSSDRTLLHVAQGLRQRVPVRKPARRDTLYDLASVTKVIATTTAIMKLRDAGDLQLDRSVADFVPIEAFRSMTLRHLLTHTAGLVPVERYYETMRSLEEMLQRYAIEGIKRPPGEMHDYSDVGFMLLGKVVEVVSGQSLDRFCAQEIFEPLGMQRTAFRPPESWKDNCAATEDDPWRGRLLVGEVHDENASAVGGVSGQAGLFSTADDLAIYCRAFMNGTVLPESTVNEMTHFGQLPLYPWQGLGWTLDPWSSKAAGFLPSRTAAGHVGWTGTSVWIDRAKDLFVILLSNTCHPNRLRRDNVALRRIVHLAVAEEYYDTTNTHTGLDRLVRENFRAIERRRIALLTNHAAIDCLDRHVLDLLPMYKDYRLVRIYSPEHGLRGRAEAGESVPSEDGPVPMTSLYGDQKEPTPEELNNVDLLVVDLQDVGARYYTYMATMKRCIEACAQVEVPVLILDRPNPLGGDVIEGPIATRTDSLVSCSAIPARHGMTMGELGTWFAENDLAELRPDLDVLYLDSWQPRRPFGECSLSWIPPSPNIPDPETALLYAGMCLFEGVNVNEGRGTETPFRVVGAPWIDPDSVLRNIPSRTKDGLRLAAIEYTPRSIPGKAANPKHQDEVCRGIRITVEDFASVRSFTTAVAIIIAIREAHPDQFAWDSAEWFDLLAGGPALRLDIEEGRDVRTLERKWNGALEDFDAKRPRFYNSDGIPFEVLD